MTKPEEIVLELGHAADAVLSVRDRIARYRAIAATSRSEELIRHFFECADELAAVEEAVGQLVLNFRRKA